MAASPPQLCTRILAATAPGADTSAAAQLAQWDAAQPEIAELWRCNSTPQGRQSLLDICFAQQWTPLLQRALAVVAHILADCPPSPAVEPPATVAVVEVTSDAESDDDDDVELHEPTRLRLAAVSRILILARNLCPTPSFQLQLRALVFATPVDTAALLSRTLLTQHARSILDVKPLLKNVLQLYANAITPGASSQSSQQAWIWAHDVLFTPVLQPFLALADPEHADLTAVSACIVHHALLCQNADTTYAADLSDDMLAAVRACVATDPSIFHALLRAALPVVHAQIVALNEDEEDDEARASPVCIWVWTWQGREPAWLLLIVGFCCRSAGDFLTRMRALCTEDEWTLMLRLVELWSESMQEGEDASHEIKRMQLASGSSAAPKSAVLTHTAEAVASNVVHLVQWLQQREHVPLPVTVLPPSPSASTDALPASATATTSLPLDAASNAVLSTLGHLLLFDGWDRSLVFSSMRAGLALNHTPALLLALLHAADVVDGGSMFSDLYRPAGHTRHTKKSAEPLDYVNQFGGAAGGSSSSSAPPVPAAPAARRTPYQFKSHIIRLIASLSFQSPTSQSAFGGDGVYACMNHSVLDEHNPLMREYAILALRNLMDEHPENQRVVEELRAEGVANQQELRELGVNTQMDPDTGKIKIANIQKPPQ